MGFVVFGRVVLFETAASDNLAKIQALQRGDDVFTTLINTGFVWSTIDGNGFNNSAADWIYAKMDEMLPQNTGFRIALTRYDANIEACRDSKTFEACFPAGGMDEISAGEQPPEDGEVVHGRRVFVKKEPPGQCESEGGGGFSAADVRFLDKYGIIFFDGDGNLDFNMSVNVNPEDELLCDENIYVELGLSVEREGRKNVDIVIVIDRSGSMHGADTKNGYTMWDRNVLHGSFDAGTRTCTRWFWGWCLTWMYDNWQNLGQFQVDRNQTFRAYLEYTGYSGSNSPKIKLTSPSDSNYGGSANYVEIPYAAPKGTWTAWGWSDDWIDYDVNIFYTKMDAAKDGAQYFVDLAEWKESDQLALVSFNNIATLDQALTTNKTAVWLAIEKLQAGGNTAVGEAVYKATGELINGASANPEAMKFQVLLSDGKTNSGRSSAGAAMDANAKGITIYTIGLGEDADETELRNIAGLTGGEYYYATDENALKKLYEIIAGEIGDDASSGAEADDVVVTVPVPEGTLVMDPGGGEFQEGDENFLVFYVGKLKYGEPWSDAYILNFPCSNSDNCENEWRVFPEDGTYVSYTDENGNPGTAGWDVNVLVDFLYRDLTVEIIGGEITGENQVYLDINAQNIGYLGSAQTMVKFYLDGTGDEGTYLTKRDIGAMCAGQDSGCSNSSVPIYDIYINAEGYIYAIINEDRENAECPNNNTDMIRCYGGAKTQYFTFEYWMWSK